MIALPLNPLAIPIDAGKEGTYRIAGTRVPLQAVVQAYNQGETVEGIVDAFPSLSLPDVYAVISYYLIHQPAVDAYLTDCETRGAAIRSEITLRPENQQWRQRLLARKTQLDAQRMKTE